MNMHPWRQSVWSVQHTCEKKAGQSVVTSCTNADAAAVGNWPKSCDLRRTALIAGAAGRTIPCSNISPGSATDLSEQYWTGRSDPGSLCLLRDHSAPLPGNITGTNREFFSGIPPRRLASDNLLLLQRKCHVRSEA